MRASLPTPTPTAERRRAPIASLATAALATSAALLVAACSSVVDRRAEQAILDALPRLLGPAERYRATVSGASPDGSRVERVSVTGERVLRADAPAIERLEVELADVRLDGAARRATSIGAASAVVQVAAADLARFVERRGWLANPEVRLLPPDAVELTGSLRVPGLALGGAEARWPTGSLRGRLVPDGPRLLLTVDVLRLGDRDLPALARGVLAAVANPLLDLSAHAVPARLDRVEVRDGVLRLEASGSALRVRAADGGSSLRPATER